jgi:hypothetical protein
MKHAIYEKLQDTARRIARGLPKPSFYARHASLVRSAEESLLSGELITQCRAYLDESRLECAHGICHCEAVARDAGAIVLAEGHSRRMSRSAINPLLTAAIIAGLLHDIKRKEQNHAFLGSIEAERILSMVGMDKRFRDYITYAIKNHEAFKQTCDLGDEAGCLVSDALYDADKFRWGPENFTTTLWLMVDSHGTSPEALHRTFREKMKGIERIKETFRTDTGKRYGPEIIDQGITIGNVIYEEMTALLRGSDAR